MAFLLHLQPDVEITLVLCLRFNAKLEEIYGCPNYMHFLMGDVTSVTKLLAFASSWGEWYPLTLGKNVMVWTRLISALLVSRAARASVLLETRCGTQTRNNAVISLFATHENKLLSHKTFEITEKYTCRAMFSQLSTPPAVLPCSQAGCLLLSPVTVAHRQHISSTSWCLGDATCRCLTHHCGSLCLPLQKKAAFTPAESH